MKRPLLIVAISLFACNSAVRADDAKPQAPEGPYIGQKTPGKTPEIFAPGFVSTSAHEFSCSFTPDGKEFYFARWDPALNFPVVMSTKLRDGKWTVPEIAPFVERSMSFEPIVTPGGERLYFMSGKPVPGQAGPPMNVFYVDREGDGWSGAKNAGAPFNPAKAMFVSSTADGTIYTTDISEGPGTEKIAIAADIGGGYKALERMGPPVNSDVPSMYPFIAPDGSYLVFNSMLPGGEVRKSVLCVSFRKDDGSWSKPIAIDLGAEAGTPFVTRDGRFLFFTAGERRKSDIYWVSSEVIEDLRPGS